MTIYHTKNSRFLAASAALILLQSIAVGRASEAACDFWPQWRGPLMTGFSPTADPPVTWSETNQVKWKVKTPGSGTASPIVWGGKVFLLTAIPTGKKAEAPAPAAGGGEGTRRSKAPEEIMQFVVLCYDRDTGKPLWQQAVREEAPHEGHHPDHGYASGSPVTDGEHLLAYFGSRGLHCLNLDGKLLWSKDLGRMQTRNSFGEGASPALRGNTVVVNWDDEGDKDFIAAFDKRTGKELWRTPRNEATGWATPLIVESGGRTEVIVNATERVRSYNLQDGKEVWQCGGQTANPIPTPVASADTAYVTSGFRGSALFAIALGRTGDLTGTDAIRWSFNKNTPYVPSPLLANDLLYLVTVNNGVLSCFDAKTGKPQFTGEKLEGITGIYASPVAAKDRVYVLGRDGSCLVIKQGPRLELLARNKLDDKTDATPALAGGEMFVRGHQYLYCLAAGKN